MTIKVEREALLRVICRQPPSVCENTLISDDGEFVLVDIPKPFMGEDFYDKSLRGATCDNDDDDSLCTLSTDSLSSTSSQHSFERRVSFATDLVSEEWTRPWTPKEEVSNLFYSTEETLR